MAEQGSASARRILVTGGGSGIGLAVVQAALAGGFDVDYTVNKTAPDLTADSGRARAHICDLSDAAALDAFTESLVERGAYYALVHCAGTTYDSLAVQAADRRSKLLFEVNFWSFVRLSKALLPPMLRSRCGRLIAVGSIVAERGGRGNSVYAASKGALAAYVRSLSAEVAGRNVTVNCVLPGVIDTKMTLGYEDKKDAMRERIPANRTGRPEEVAQAVDFLLQPGASYITGASLSVDGGVSTSMIW